MPLTDRCFCAAVCTFDAASVVAALLESGTLLELRWPGIGAEPIVPELWSDVTVVAFASGSALAVGRRSVVEGGIRVDIRLGKARLGRNRQAVGALVLLTAGLRQTLGLTLQAMRSSLP